MDAYIDRKKVESLSFEGQTFNNRNGTQKSRNLSDQKPGSNMKLLNDTSLSTRPSDQFYKFMDVSRNTRLRLVGSNKDIFIIWGQNGFIATLFTVAYLVVWISGIGASVSKIAKTFVYL